MVIMAQIYTTVKDYFCLTGTILKISEIYQMADLLESFNFRRERTVAGKKLFHINYIIPFSELISTFGEGTNQRKPHGFVETEAVVGVVNIIFFSRICNGNRHIYNVLVEKNSFQGVVKPSPYTLAFIVRRQIN